MASKVKGVYIAVELDQTSLKASVKKAVGTLKNEFQTVKSTFGDAIDIDTTKVSRKFTQLAHAIADINNEINTQSGAAMFTDALRKSDQFRDSLQNIASMTGSTVEKVQENFARVLDASKIQNIVSSYNKYVKMLSLSNEEAIEHAKALGIVGEALDRIKDKYTEVNKADTETKVIARKFAQFSSALTDIRSNTNANTGAGMFSTALRDSNQLKESLNDVIKLTGLSADKVKESFSRALDTSKINSIVSGYSKYVSMLNLSNEEAIEHAKALGIVGVALDRIKEKYDKVKVQNIAPTTNESSLLTSLRHMMTTGNAMAAIQASIATLGANLSFAGITELGKAMVTTTVRVDSLRTAFESIYKDGNRAAAQLDYIRQVTDDVGLEFYATAEAAKGFFAAAETSTIKENAEEIFHAFSAASSALKLTQDQTGSVFLAISQMMSKGKISAEEMRQQLAERLPGAVQLLASAMGVTLQKLDKMFENGEVGLENLVLLAREVEKVYGEAGTAAGRALLGEMNKLSSAWTDFKAAFIDSGEITDALQKMRGFVESLTGNIDKLKNAIDVLGFAIMGAFTGFIVKQFGLAINGLHGEISKLKENFKSLGAVGVFKGLASSLANNMSLITAFGFAAYEMWQVWDDHTTKGTLKVRDFKAGLDGASESLDYMAEKAKGASKEVQELLVMRLENAAHTAKAELKGVMDSFGNLAEAIEKSASNIDLLKFVPKLESGGVDYRAWSKTQEFIRDMASQVRAVQSQVEQGGIGAETAVQRLEDVKNKLKDAGFEGSEAFSMLIRMQNELAKGTENAVKTQETLKSTLEDIAKQAKTTGVEIANMLQIASGSGNKLDLDNLKKQLQLEKDVAGQAYVDLMTSGDLRTLDGKKFTLSATDLAADLSVVKAGLTDYATLITKVYGGTEDLAESFRKNIELTRKLSDTKGVAQVVKKFEDYEAKLVGLKSRWEELNIASMYASDTLDYKLAKIAAESAKADEKVEKLVRDLRNVRMTEADKALIEMYTRSINTEEERRKQEEVYKVYVDEARSAAEEIAALNGQTNKNELARMVAHHNDMLEALDRYHEMGKIKTEEYNTLRIAAEESYQRNALSASTDWKDGFRQGAQKLQDDASNYASKWSDITVKSFSGLADVMADFATSTERSWASLEDAFSKLAISICNDIIKIATQAAASNLAQGLFGGAGSSGLIGGMVSAVGGFFGFADGGVVNTGLQPYSNGVYSKPTFFSMGTARHFANGGVFGEAGPEAIMPLSRMPDGRLGVASSNGGGGSNVQVNVYNSSNSKATVRQSSDSSGGKTVDVLIGEVVAKQMVTPGTKLNRAVSSQTGSSQPVVRR